MLCPKATCITQHSKLITVDFTPAEELWILCEVPYSTNVTAPWWLSTIQGHSLARGLYNPRKIGTKENR